MSKKLSVPGLDTLGERKPKSGKGFAGREVLAELAHSQQYSLAIDRITSNMACTDIRELLRIVPESFRGVFKIEISLGKEEPFISAFVHEDKVVFTGPKRSNDKFVITDVPLVLKDATDSREIGNMRIMSFFPLFLDIYRSGDQADTMKVLGMLGSLIARTIDARLDGLTALPVRKYFDRALEEHVARFQSDGRNFSLIALDIDRFKSINDEMGHDTGDRVLAGLARVLFNGVRGRADCTDMVYRTGGEEFAIILPGVSLVEAGRVAERQRFSIKRADFGIGREVTCSFGVAEMNEVSGAETPVEAIYKLADSRLYDAKSERDSVVSSTGKSMTRLRAVRDDLDKAGNE